jgi:hypothetical protein
MAPGRPCRCLASFRSFGSMASAIATISDGRPMPPPATSPQRPQRPSDREAVRFGHLARHPNFGRQSLQLFTKSAFCQKSAFWPFALSGISDADTPFLAGEMSNGPLPEAKVLADGFGDAQLR